MLILIRNTLITKAVLCDIDTGLARKTLTGRFLSCVNCSLSILYTGFGQGGLLLASFF